MKRIVTEAMPVYPVRREEVLAAALRQLQTGDWARLEGAPETEEALKEFHGGGIVWFVSSGLAALQAVLLGHGIGPGDEVITTPYTWGATVSAVLGIGAVPVFADIDPRTGLMDPATVDACVTPRTRAILPVHLFGQACDMDRFRTLAERHGVLLIEDGSQAHGARYRGMRVGRFGHGSGFSCMGLKLLAGTEGGYAVFESEVAARAAYLYGKHQRGVSAETYASFEGLLDSVQFTWRPCPVSAELVRAALPYLEEERAARRANAAHLRSCLQGVRGVTMPEEPADTEGCYHLLSLVYEEEVTGKSRADFVRDLHVLGAGAFVYIPVPLHRLPRMQAFEYEGPRVFWHEQLLRAGCDYRAVSCPQAEWRAGHSVEFGFNWTEENPRAMEQLAEAIMVASRPA
jgi:dTDP-4-amino-4,6-dideoxygalactose transaminase